MQDEGWRCTAGTDALLVGGISKGSGRIVNIVMLLRSDGEVRATMSDYRIQVVEIFFLKAEYLATG